jgi:hypothetical protein
MDVFIARSSLFRHRISSHLTESAHTVSLYLEDLDVAIPLLVQCKSLVRLDVDAYSRDRMHSFNLDRIGHFLPSLKILKITLPDNFNGSLQHNQELEELSLDATLATPASDDYFLLIVGAQTLFSVGSAEKLTRLHLEAITFQPTQSLKMFTSLKHLSTAYDPIDITLARLIVDLPVSLCSLASAVDTTEWAEDVPLNERYDLVDCSCLTRLKKIRLLLNHAEPDDEGDSAPIYVDGCMEVVTKIVKNMQLLEEVELHGGFDIERIHILGQLPKLRWLRWTISRNLEWILSGDQYAKHVGSRNDLTSRVRGIFTGMGKDVEWMKIEVE